MRISDWSSDVCSSDLLRVPAHVRIRVGAPRQYLQAFVAGVPQRRFHPFAGNAAAAHLGRHFGVVDGKDVALARVLDEGLAAVLADREAPAVAVMADSVAVHSPF